MTSLQRKRENLSPQQKQELVRIEIQVLYKTGMDYKQIREQTKSCMKRIKKWCRTYDEMGCFTYKDKPRSGRPRKLTDEMINDVVQWRTCSETATTKQKTNPECAALLS